MTPVIDLSSDFINFLLGSCQAEQTTQFGQSLLM